MTPDQNHHHGSSSSSSSPSCRFFFLTLIILIILLIFLTGGIKCQETWTYSELLSETYDKTVPPKNAVDHKPINVSVTLKVTQLINVDESDQSFTIDILYVAKWPDHRLTFPPKSEHTYPLNRLEDWKSKLWLPEVYLANALSPSIIKLEPLFLEIDANSSLISMTSRQVVKLRCHMDLFRFPQDAQSCAIELTLLTTIRDKVQLKWDSFALSSQKQFPNFYVVRKKTSNCTSLRGEDYSCIASHIKLFRNVSYYMTRIYGPSFLLVITAFVGFWIPPMGYPARVGVVVTPMLSLVTQQTQINAEIKVSYVVAVHIWMIFSIIFVFLSLVEYALAIVYHHSIDEKKELRTRDPIGFTYAFDSTSKISHWIKRVLIRIYGEVDYAKNPMDRNKVDYAARIIFPILYFIFIMIYIFVFLIPWVAEKYYYDL